MNVEEENLEMKDICADPGSTDDAVSSSSISSPSVSDGSLLAMSDLVLDRSEDVVSPVTEFSIDPSATTETGRKSSTTKRYPSFRDLFKPLRARSLSTSPEDLLTTQELKKLKKKKKKKKDGCAGWLEKKKRRKNSSSQQPGCSSSSAESSNGIGDLPPLLKTLELEEDDEAVNCLKCSRCCRIDGPPGSKGVTYTKRPAGVDEQDESWLCTECLHSLRRNSVFQQPDDDEEEDDYVGLPFERIAPLAHLALNVLIVSHVSYYLLSF